MIDLHEKQAELVFRSWLMLLLAILIALWGLGAIYGVLSASGKWEHFLVRQALWTLTALALLALLWRTPFDRLARRAVPLGLGGWLALALLPWFGMRINGMRGWYDAGSVMIQPSELVKGLYLLLLVRILTRPGQTQRRRVLEAGAVMIGFGGLILAQPDWGTALVFAAGGLGALYFCRVDWRWLAASGAVGAAGLIAVIFRHEYMLRRILSFADPGLDPGGAGWHQRQFAIAAARGEWFGVKGEMAVWSAGFLPLSHNDSIYSGLTEATGVVGAGLLLFLFGVWFRQWFRLGELCCDPMRRGYLDTAAAMVLFQTLLHVGVNLGMLPPTGITLPLVSYGGSSMLGTMLMLGLALSAVREELAGLPELARRR